jgi:beta-lactamase superfamily II metal-dependent hydrolase
MARRSRSSPTARQLVSTEPAKRAALNPPRAGASVRMYRTGHGDCFLLAFPGDGNGKPVHVLIDCGYKPGSQSKIEPPTDIKAIAKHILEATGGFVDVAIITHEHQDHVNGITPKNFEGLEIGEVWLAWTDDPEDDLANELRRRYRDRLLGLLNAHRRLAFSRDNALNAEQAEGAKECIKQLEQFLAFELGGDDENFDDKAAFEVLGADGDPSRSKNKQSMKLFKDKAQSGVRYLRPHESVHSIARTKDLRVFVLGPPRSLAQLRDLEPGERETFDRRHLALLSPGHYFAAAAGDGARSPFSGSYAIAWADAADDPEVGSFIADHYGRTDKCAQSSAYRPEVEDSAPWRRIDEDWLYAADQLAIDMNDETNNSSLVLAFELGRGGKVLLFAADAQAGNWRSWSLKDWKDGDMKVTARDLLARTVLYKVGHHGSHNATLNGAADDDHPNLAWMGQGEHGREFTAMITAVEAWAKEQNDWAHPLKAIKDALMKKASGRVLQTDTALKAMLCPPEVPLRTWEAFEARVTPHDLYFDYRID